MTPLVVSLVLSAALLHAIWNSLVKVGGSPEFVIGGFHLVGAVISLFLIPFVPPPARESWPMIFASVVIHNAYYLTLARAYRSGDLGQVYPLFRGLAPLLVALGGMAFADEWLSAGKLVGIGVVSLGIMSLALPKGKGRLPSKPLFWGMLTAFLIACYTVVDGLGVRVAGSRLGYIVWLFLCEMIPFCTFLLLTHRQGFMAYLKTHWHDCLLGGIASSGAYGLVIFAMSLGAMAVVSSLRETSVIFAAIIATFVLKEPFGRQRIVAAIFIASGVVLMQVL